MSDSREPYVSPSLEASRRRIAARRQEQETLGRLLAPIERQKLEIGLAGLSPEQQKTTRETFLQARALNQIYDIPMDDALVRGDLYRRALAPDIKKAQGFIEHSVDNIRLNSLMWDIGTEHWAVARNHGEPLEKGQSVEIMRKELEEVLKRKADFQKRMRDGGIDIGGGNYVKPNMTPEERAEEEQLIKRERELNKMLSGRGADVGGGNYVPVDNEITLADLEAEEEKIKARLFTDSDVVSAMGTAIGTLGFMKYSAPAALAATVATGGNALAGSAVAAAVDYSALAGLAYRDMRRAGIEHEVAFSKAAISAGAQSLLEFAFGATPVEGFVTRKIGGLISTRFVMKGTVAKAVADVARNGVGTRAAAKALAVATAKEAIAGAPIRALMEGATEAAQALTSNFMMELAAIESDRMFGGVDFKAIEENKENIAENFFMGALASGLLGVVPSTIKVLSTPAQVAKVKQDVVTALFETGSVEGAVKKLEGTAAEELLTTEGVKQAVETVRQEYKKQLGERDVEIAPGMIEPTPDTPAAARRDANGRLALYEEADVDRKGNSVLSVKSPVGDNTYASITFKRDGDRIILKDAKAEGYVTDGDAVISEALKALKKENPRAVFDGRRDLMVAAETKMGLSEVRAVDALLKEMMGLHCLRKMRRRRKQQ